MTKMDWDKAAEYFPDPGSVVEVPDLTRPYTHVSEEEKVRRRTARALEEKARVDHMRLVEKYRQLDPRAREIKLKNRQRIPLSFFENATLKRWRELRVVLGFSGRK